jgi:AcrR family transcriptional regulator
MSAPARLTTDLRTQTLAVARRLIAERGHRDVSMRDIAGEVGCSVSSLYGHFDSRDALMHTLIDEGFARLYAEQQAIERAHLEPWTRLEATARRYVEFGLAHPELYDIMFMFHPRSMKRLPRELFRRIRRSLDLTTENVRVCGGDRQLAEQDARVVAAAIWATLHGVVSTLLTQRLDSRIDRGRYVDVAVHSVLATVRSAARRTSDGRHE